MDFLLFLLDKPEIAPHLDEVKLLGIKVLNPVDFLQMALRFSLNFALTLIIVRGLYYRTSRRPDYVFTYLLISTVVFLMCFLLESVKLELGFALGLFAIFGIIRYRTDPIPIKEMTYLFVIIGVSVMNALSNKKVSYAELLFANLIIVGLLAILEANWIPRNEATLSVQYEKAELILPQRRQELIADLRARTGLDVRRVEIGAVSFLRDTAELTLYYLPDGHPNHRPVQAASEAAPAKPPSG
jgi:hypothetical protein